MYVLGVILVMVGGVVLANVGFPFYTWQYWAISVPLIVGAVFMGANQ